MLWCGSTQSYGTVHSVLGSHGGDGQHDCGCVHALPVGQSSTYKRSKKSSIAREREGRERGWRQGWEESKILSDRGERRRLDYRIKNK